MIRCAVTGLRVFGFYAVVTELHFFVHPVMTRGMRGLRGWMCEYETNPRSAQLDETSHPSTLTAT